MDNQRKQRRVWLTRALIGGLLVLAIVLVVLAIRHVLANQDQPKKQQVRQITLLKPPVPPPPPKPEEKPPEPEVKKEEVKLPDPTPQDQPKPADEPPPPAQNLGVDAEGGAGTDGFGLIGNKGGRDITAGFGNGNGNSRFGHYVGVMKQELESALSDDKRLHGKEYKTNLKLWLSADGGVERFELVGPSGDPQTVEVIKAVLAGVKRFREAPPADMPRYLILRLAAR